MRLSAPTAVCRRLADDDQVRAASRAGSRATADAGEGGDGPARPERDPMPPDSATAARRRAVGSSPAPARQREEQTGSICKQSVVSMALACRAEEESSQNAAPVPSAPTAKRGPMRGCTKGPSCRAPRGPGAPPRNAAVAAATNSGSARSVELGDGRHECLPRRTGLQDGPARLGVSPERKPTINDSRCLGLLVVYWRFALQPRGRRHTTARRLSGFSCFWRSASTRHSGTDRGGRSPTRRDRSSGDCSRSTAGARMQRSRARRP